jgi:hypothetical protein
MPKRSNENISLESSPAIKKKMYIKHFKKSKYFPKVFPLIIIN